MPAFEGSDGLSSALLDATGFSRDDREELDRR